MTFPVTADETYLEAVDCGDFRLAAKLVADAALAQELSARNARDRLRARFYEEGDRTGFDAVDANLIFEQYVQARLWHKDTEVLMRHTGSRLLDARSVTDPLQSLAGGNDESGYPVARRMWNKGAQVRTHESIGEIYEAVGEGILFRGVSKDDYERIIENGFIDTDFRAAITEHEGINLSPDARTAQYYLPAGADGIIIAIDTKGIPLHMISSDSYVRSFSPIPAARIVAVSPFMTKDQDGAYLTYAPSPIVCGEDGTPIPLSKRFRVSPGGEPLTLQEMNAIYMRVAKSNDLDAAQLLVNEAAKMAGFGVGPVWHGSDEDDFHEFENQKTSYGFFFSPDRDTAGFYGQTKAFFLKSSNLANFDDQRIFNKVAAEAIWNLDEGRDEPAVKAVLQQLQDTPVSRQFAKNALGLADNQMSEYASWEQIIDDVGGSIWGDEFEPALDAFSELKNDMDAGAPIHSKAIKYAQDAYGSQNFYMTYQNDFLRAAERMGYDSVFLLDPAGSTGGAPESHVVFNAKQIKSSEPIVYDGDGNIVPLTRRFLPAKDVRGAISGKDQMAAIDEPMLLAARTSGPSCSQSSRVIVL